MSEQQRLISKTDFSKKVGISQCAVTKLIKGSLGPAMVGDRIDFAHESVDVYLAKKKKRDSNKRKKELAEIEAASNSTDDEIADAQSAASGAKPAKITHLPPVTQPKQTKLGTKKRSNNISDGYQPPDDDELAHYNNMTIKEVIQRYGTFTAFKDLLSSTKIIEDIRSKRIANAAKDGDLISKEHVQNFVFGAIESIDIRLIQDSPRTITARVLTAVESGDNAEKIEGIVRKLISSQLRSMKKEVIKGINSAKVSK